MSRFRIDESSYPSKNPLETQGIPELAELSLVDSEETVEEASEPERDLVQHYINEATRIPLLNPEETRRYSLQFQSGNKAERSEAHAVLVEHNLRLVIKIALDFQKYWRHSRLDLIQEGNIGLMHAIKKFDPDRGVKLSYYASFWIKAYIMKFIMDNWHQVKIGTTQDQRKLFYNLKREKEKLRLQGFDPDAEIIAASLGVSKAAVEEMEQRMASRGLSLSDTLKEDSESEHGDFIADDGPDQLELLIGVDEKQVLVRKLNRLRLSLDDREIFILDQRILVEKPARLQSIGRHFEVSRERIRQIEARLIEKINLFLRKGVLPVNHQKNGDKHEVPSSESFLSFVKPADADNRTFFANYIESVSSIEPLTAREEKIALGLRRKNDTSCDVLAEANLHLVVDIVLESASSGKRKLTADDLFSLLKQGNESLLRTVRRYQNKDGEFQAFIAAEIRQEILSCISAIALAKKCWTKKFFLLVNRFLGEKAASLSHYRQMVPVFQACSDDQRRIFESRYGDGFSVLEVQRSHKCPKYIVNAKVSRVITRIKSALSDAATTQFRDLEVYSVALLNIRDQLHFQEETKKQDWMELVMNTNLSNSSDVLSLLEKTSLRKIRELAGEVRWRIFSPKSLLPLCLQAENSKPYAFTEKQTRRFFLLFGIIGLGPREFFRKFGVNRRNTFRARRSTLENIAKKIKSHFSWRGGHVLFPKNQLSFWPEWEQTNLPLFSPPQPKILSLDRSTSPQMTKLAKTLLDNRLFLADLRGGTSPKILGLFLDRLNLGISGKDKIKLLRLIYGKRGARRSSYSALSREIGWSASTVKKWWSGILDEIRDFILRTLKEQQ